MDKILSQLIELYEHWKSSGAAGSEQVDQLLVPMREVVVNGDVRPNSLPVVDKWLSAENTQSHATRHSELIALIHELADQMDWIALPPDYAGAELSENFAFTTIAGPREKRNRPTYFETDQFACGISLQSPGIFYAPHNHKAVEFYAILSGTSRWQLGNNAPQTHPPGSYIFHESDVPHAMETGDDLLLCAWAWIGDLMSPIEVPSMDWL